ncbi:MAG TPA: AMP-binding protein [Actinomycetes bacterium]|nr:AMP-binding protein [Actinomycetes bacterium]
MSEPAGTTTAAPGDRANLADLVRTAAGRVGDRPALRQPVPAGSGGTGGTGGTAVQLTWGELDRDVDAMAVGLRREMHLQPGDRVALSLSNTVGFVTSYFGALRAGLVVVPLNTGYTAPEVAGLLGDAGAKAVICEDATTAVVEEAVAGTHRVVVDPAGLDSVLAGGRRAGPVEAGRGGEDLAVLMFTSGTSGRPRGAMLSHRALLANLHQCGALEPPPMRADDVVLLVLPLFHVYGLQAGLGMVAATAATGVLVDRFDPAGTLGVVRDEGVTNIPGAPPMYVAWSVQPGLEALGGVRLLASGASSLPPDAAARVQAATGLTVHEGYGLTEAAPVVATTLASPGALAGSIGRPLPGVETRLLDEQGNPVDEGDPGEIWVRGDNLFSGYWPDGVDGPADDGWWATGDVAITDERGDLVIVDRRKELVLVSGFNVYPREVEDALVQHPGVAEAAVVGVPDPQTGEAVHAFVVPVDGNTLTTLTPDDVLAHAATRLARFKRPSTVEVVDELPHSVTGKVAKGRLREALE